MKVTKKVNVNGVAITHVWEALGMERVFNWIPPSAPEGTQPISNVIKNIEWKLLSTRDDDTIGDARIEKGGMWRLDIEDPEIVNRTDFVSYEEITEEMVLNWAIEGCKWASEGNEFYLTVQYPETKK